MTSTPEQLIEQQRRYRKRNAEDLRIIRYMRKHFPNEYRELRTRALNTQRTN